MKIILLFLLATASLQAADFTFDKETGQTIPTFVGEIKDFKGTVSKKTDGKFVKVNIGTRFNKNDTVVTSASSFARIQIADDTLLTISSNSELTFSEFIYKDKSNREVLFSLLKGQIRALVKQKLKEGSIEVKTVNATLGVRGTELMVNHRTLNKLEVSEFGLISGSAIVTDFKEQKFELQKNDRVVILRDQANDSASEQIGIMQEELEQLKIEENFLPYYGLEKVNKDSALFLLLSKSLSTAQKEEKKVGSTKSGDASTADWRQNLIKLNEKLRENQLRRTKK